MSKGKWLCQRWCEGLQVVQVKVPGIQGVLGSLEKVPGSLGALNVTASAGLAAMVVHTLAAGGWLHMGHHCGSGETV